MPGDEFRVEVSLRDEAHGQSLGERLRSLAMDDEARERLGGDVIVTRDDLRLFLYASDERGAREAERVIRDLLQQDGLQADVAVKRWHPVQEEWVDASVPLPEGEADRALELERKELREQQEAHDEGDTDWDVRATFDSHQKTEEVGDQLEADGMLVTRRWRHLVVKVVTEEDASALEKQLRAGGATEVELEARDVTVGGPFRFFAGIFG
jgi:hypothetical protein